MDSNQAYVENAMRCDSMQEVIDNLWIGSAGAVLSDGSIMRLAAHNIHGVITVADEIRIPSVAMGTGIDYVQFFIDDAWNQRVIHLFDPMCSLIDCYREQYKGVLLHCQQGKSRSATFVAAYLIRKHGMSAKEAIEAIREKRRVVDPIEEFVRQLEEYEERVKSGK